MIEDDQMDLNMSAEKKTTNYAHLNEEFGDVDISGKFCYSSNLMLFTICNR
jgi:hypothetical protein